MLGFVGGQPFLEEGREGVAVDDHTVDFRTDGDLTVASQGQFCKPLSATIPMGKADEFVDIDLMEDVTACESVVETQGAVVEIILKPLGNGIKAGSQ